MSLPEVGFSGLGLALASLWWNSAVWVLRICDLAVVERWLLPRKRAEHCRDNLHFKAVGDLDRASIRTVEKVWPSDNKPPQDSTETKKHNSCQDKTSESPHVILQIKSYLSPFFSCAPLSQLPRFHLYSQSGLTSYLALWVISKL